VFRQFASGLQKLYMDAIVRCPQTTEVKPFVNYGNRELVFSSILASRDQKIKIN